MEAKLKHLEMIQGVISRMASNLFFLKGWVITLIAGLFALSAKATDPKYVYITYFLVIIFWVLDGYFLSQERLFRALYNDVRKLNEKDIDFSMDTSKYKDISRNGWLCSILLILVTLFTAFLINYI